MCLCLRMAAWYVSRPLVFGKTSSPFQRKNSVVAYRSKADDSVRVLPQRTFQHGIKLVPWLIIIAFHTALEISSERGARDPSLFLI